MPVLNIPRKPEEIEGEIRELAADLKRLKRDVEEYKHYETTGANVNESVYAISRAFIRDIEFKLEKARKRLKYAKSFYPIGSNRQFQDVSYEIASEEGGDLVDFEKFKGQFTTSVGVWAVSIKTSVLDLAQSIKNAKLDADDGKLMLAVSILTTLVKKAGPVGKAIGYGKAVYDEVNKNAKFNQKDVQNLATKMAEALHDAAVKQEILDPAFENFVEFWKLKNSISRDQTSIPYKVFQDEVIYFPQRNLPTPEEVKREMIVEMFKYLKDDEWADWDGDGSEAGYVRVEMYCPENPYGIEYWDRGDWEKWVSSRNSFNTKAYLDDVSSSLKTLFKDNFKGFRLIDLPMKLVFKWTLPTGWNRKKEEILFTEYEFTRDDLRPGNYNFYQSGGSIDHFVLNTFYDKRIYQMLKVNSLT